MLCVPIFLLADICFIALTDLFISIYLISGHLYLASQFSHLKKYMEKFLIFKMRYLNGFFNICYLHGMTKKNENTRIDL